MVARRPHRSARSRLWPLRSRLPFALRVAAYLPGMLHLRAPDTGMAADHVGDARGEDEMSTGTLSDLDVRVRERVVHQLDWDPEVDASGIGVAASNGVVTLTGYVDTYSGKLAAERAAKRVRGV